MSRHPGVSAIYKTAPWGSEEFRAPKSKSKARKMLKLLRSGALHIGPKKKRKPTPKSWIERKAHEMRSNMTPPESALWRHLKVFKFKAQYPILEKYIADFYHPDLRIVVEVDGKQHEAPAAKERDDERDADMRRIGIIVLRFTASRVFSNLSDVVRLIKQAISSRRNAAEPEACGRRAGSREVIPATEPTMSRGS